MLPTGNRLFYPLVVFWVFLVCVHYRYFVYQGDFAHNPYSVSENERLTPSLPDEVAEADIEFSKHGPPGSLPPPAASTATTTASEEHLQPLIPYQPVAKAIIGIGSTGIPKKIWNKMGPHGVSEDAQKWIGGCLKQNPEFRHEILGDDSGDEYVRSMYTDRPDIVSTYMSLTVPILKADFLRYLILYNEGGVWNDMDVDCAGIPINKWIPEQHMNATKMVIGLEFDKGFCGYEQFASWTILAAPRSPYLKQLIEDIITGIHDLSRTTNKPIPELVYKDVPDVVSLTGPVRMTQSVKKTWEKMGIVYEDQLNDITEPKLMGEVLILPGNSFANLQNGFPGNPKFDRGNVSQGPTLVSHQYAGTWKNDIGGEELMTDEKRLKAQMVAAEDEARRKVEAEKMKLKDHTDLKKDEMKGSKD